MDERFNNERNPGCEHRTEVFASKCDAIAVCGEITDGVKRKEAARQIGRTVIGNRCVNAVSRRRCVDGCQSESKSVSVSVRYEESIEQLFEKMKARVITSPTAKSPIRGRFV